MDNVSIIISSLENKIKKIVDLQNYSSAENNSLRNENYQLNKIVEEQKIKIKKLEEKVEVLKIAKSVDEGENVFQTKLKINELVREIDKCIALLNN